MRVASATAAVAVSGMSVVVDIEVSFAYHRGASTCMVTLGALWL
jgi:hypothetical protein